MPVNRDYDIPAQFYYDTLPIEMHPIVEGVCWLEDNYGISSMYLLLLLLKSDGEQHLYHLEITTGLIGLQMEPII